MKTANDAEPALRMELLVKVHRLQRKLYRVGCQQAHHLLPIVTLILHQRRRNVPPPMVL